MSEQPNIAGHNAAVEGDLQRLAEQLGQEDAVSLLSPVISQQFERIHTVKALREFLTTYRDERLLRHELPMILRAWQHAVRGETRELLALDKTLAQDETTQALTSASRHVGRTHLRRFRPLKDVRLVQKYLAAIDNGEANGWHTLVYGIMLSLFSLPLRQGFANYGFQTIHSFICSASPRVGLMEADAEKLTLEMVESLNLGINQILSAHQPTELRLAE